MIILGQHDEQVCLMNSELYSFCFLNEELMLFVARILFWSAWLSNTLLKLEKETFLSIIDTLNMNWLTDDYQVYLHG